MSARSMAPDLSTLEVPWDIWGEPFWRATAERQLLMPSCEACGTFRWPPGPFCAKCQSQKVAWQAPGQGRIYSFTVLPAAAAEKDAPPQYRVPVLVEFDQAPGVRLVSALIDAPLKNIAIGAAVEVDWLAAANATVPVFRLLEP
jgi:uncharacterized OB-fold protein